MNSSLIFNFSLFALFSFSTAANVPQRAACRVAIRHVHFLSPFSNEESTENIFFVNLLFLLLCKIHIYLLAYFCSKLYEKGGAITKPR